MISGFEDYDALGLADLVKRREVQPIEVLETAILLTERYNPDLNAVVHTMYEHAREIASAPLDLKAPFAGVPFLLKDLIAQYQGEPTTGSCKILEGIPEKQDSELVRRFRKAGLITFGKTNTPEFGIMGITEPEFRGPSRNPWDVSKSTGGSSGGSGAAVAARMVPMAHGGDGGGSIRIPSSHCGLVGMLPSRGRNPMGPNLGEAWGGLAREHVLTRSVRDSAAMLDCLSGVDVGAPYSAPLLEESSFQSAAAENNRSFSIGFSRKALYCETIHPDCVDAVEKTVKLLEQMGHTVEEAHPEFDRQALARAYLQIVCAWVAWEIKSSATKAGRSVRSGDYELTSWVMGLVGRKNSGTELAEAIHTCHKAARMMGRYHQKYDLFLTATTAQPPSTIGDLYPSGSDATAMKILKTFPLKALLNKALDGLAEDALSATPNTQLFNQTGQPALSLPLHRNAMGLPIGVQFAAKYGNEWALYRIASQLEIAAPWIHEKPPLISGHN